MSGNLKEKYLIMSGTSGQIFNTRKFDSILEAEYWLEKNGFDTSDKMYSMVYVRD